MSHVLRRLRRVCALYGADPTFVLASATVAEPEVAAGRLTGHEHSRVHLGDLTVPHDVRPGHLQRHQRLHRPPGAELHDEPDRDVDGQHGSDGRRVQPIAGQERGSGRRGQEQDDGAAELRHQDPPCRGRRHPLEVVRSVSAQAIGCFGAREPLRARPQSGEHLRNREGMPHPELYHALPPGKRGAATGPVKRPSRRSHLHFTLPRLDSCCRAPGGGPP